VLELVPEGKSWRELDELEQVSLVVLERQIRYRCEQREHEPLEQVGGRRDCIFLTAKRVQRLLGELRYRRRGEKFARTIIATLERLSAIEDTLQTKKPRRSAQRLAAAERFSSTPPALTGGRDAQPSIFRSYWWRVFRVPAIARVLVSRRALGAYDSGVVLRRPQALASLSALLRRQVPVTRRRAPSSFSKGSAQWVFANSGPP